MTKSVLVLGGYGNFGKRIASALSMAGYAVLIAGRNQGKAEALAQQLPQAQAVVCDIHTGLVEVLATYQPAVVVHTAGPFYGTDYFVAQTCIKAGVHYIDLADGRDFVTGFTALDAQAKAAGITAISGASTVPALSSAVVEHFKHEFATFESIDFGICPARKPSVDWRHCKAFLPILASRCNLCWGKSAMAGRIYDG